MSTNLYEILDIQANATPEQIRKAYKKRALQTHPDRAPASDKAQAEERFRQVNNAYEVLIDPQKRLSYDRHGVWPPPTEDLPPHPQNNTRGHSYHPNIFTFTDPFELFESFFGHPSPLHDPFPFGPSRNFPHPFFAPTGFSFPSSPLGPFGPFNPRVRGGLFHDTFAHDSFMLPMMGGGLFQSQGAGSGERSASYFSSTSYPSRQGTSGNQWISESRSTSTINGLTTSVHERVDPLGNIHTTTTHPGGHEIYTINGVPQGSGQFDAPPTPYTPHSNPMEHPRRPHHHHHHHHDHPRGRQDCHNTYRAYDRDYSPDRRNPRHPSS
ncbi:DnaJ-domain-containing protein [Thelephora ganbajun]|uniref:DnaJ-domain-containing protein n=1 Tax=Thelephora ganbajun TaxID=370292 RepID=A0ACB6Z1T8_THEGA|nr:DnaJ-domain-containing protein [Thelephora ganbajun]